MTTFIFGNEGGLTFYVRPTGMYFWSDNVVVCGRHLRESLQPVTSYDLEVGYGTSNCPFCLGGQLYGQFSKARSIKKWEELLDSLS